MIPIIIAMRRVCVSVAALSLLLAIIRVVVADSTNAQGFDEPTHVVAGMQWLSTHTYTVDPVHPPFARYAIALPLYVAGARMPDFVPGDPSGWNYNDAGDAILNKDGQYRRNLFLARIGILPFLCLASLILFWWTRAYFSDAVACVAVALFTTTPSILAFSAMAYNDLPVAALQLAFLCVLIQWLENATPRRTVLLGIVGGLAFATKFTSLLFLTACTLAMLICRYLVDRRAHKPSPDTFSGALAKLGTAAVLGLVVLWSTYGFSTGHVRETTGLSPTTMPSFQHFPGPTRELARRAVLSDPVVPAPELINGFARIWVVNQTGPPAYLFGHEKNGGWWFFFPIAFALKSPLPLLLFAVWGTIYMLRRATHNPDLAQLMPIVCTLTVFGVASLGKYQVGTRYLLVVFPLLAILAGVGTCAIWKKNARWWARLLVIGLLSWQAVVTISARHDFLAYFNEVAPADPSKALVLGCDLDCGQDLLRLADELRSHGISQVALGVWSSAELTQIGLPKFTLLEPSRPVKGWVAVSARARRAGDVMHKTYPPETLDWLNSYEPVAHVGKTILLYYIPG